MKPRHDIDLKCEARDHYFRVLLLDAFQQPLRPRGGIRMPLLLHQPVIAPPVHAFWLARKWFGHVAGSAELHPYLLRLQKRTFMRRPSLASIRELVAPATSKDAAASIENCYSPFTPFRGATEPQSTTAVVAGRPFEHHRILLLPPSAVTLAEIVAKNHAANISLDVYRSSDLASPCPLQVVLSSRFKQILTV